MEEFFKYFERLRQAKMEVCDLKEYGVFDPISTKPDNGIELSDDLRCYAIYAYQDIARNTLADIGAALNAINRNSANLFQNDVFNSFDQSDLCFRENQARKARDVFCLLEPEALLAVKRCVSTDPSTKEGRRINLLLEFVPIFGEMQLYCMRELIELQQKIIHLAWPESKANAEVPYLSRTINALWHCKQSEEHFELIQQAINRNRSLLSRRKVTLNRRFYRARRNICSRSGKTFMVLVAVGSVGSSILTGIGGLVFTNLAKYITQNPREILRIYNSTANYVMGVWS